MNLEKTFLKLLMFWLPVPVSLIMAFTWWKHTGDYAVASYAVLMPLSYGYIIPFIAINILKRWRFKNGLMIGSMYVHHGFMYASKMSFFGFIPMLLLKKQELDFATSCAWIICTALPYAFSAWLQDALCMKYNYIEFGNDENLNRNKESVVLSYAPICFTLIGTIYAVGLIAMYKCFLSQQCLSRQSVLIFMTTFILLATVPSIVYNVSSNQNSKTDRG